MNDFHASHSRSEIFQSPDNLDTTEHKNNNDTNLNDPETLSLSYDSVNQENTQANQQFTRENHVTFAQNDDLTDKSDEEEIHYVNMVVTIVAAFPAGLFIDRLFIKIS